jgi:hypothetical protein
MAHQLELQIGLDAIASYRRLSYTPWHALAEFVDNATQAYANNKESLDALYAREGDRLEVSIEYEAEDDLIRISDTASGMDQKELAAALKIGNRPENAMGRSRYGLGMKTAACWLGDHWTVRTKKFGETKEYAVEIDVPRVSQGDPDVRLKTKDDQPQDKHYSLIEIRKLHRVFKGRTLGKIRNYLRSMYRDDFRHNRLVLRWRGEELSWEELDGSLLRSHDGNTYKKPFKFDVHGKMVEGWVGVLASGSRANAGFSILHCGRVVRGWPDAWRPSSLYGQIQGSNDLINQRLVGEIHLDAFDVSHTKDDILWLGDEEDVVEEKLEDACRDYREVARKHRKRGTDQRGPTEIETQTALEELKKELTSPEIIDTIRLETAPDPDVIRKSFETLIAAEKARPETFRVQLDGITLKAYLSMNRSENDPYFVSEATNLNEVIVVINRTHPHWAQLSGSENVLNFFRHCVYDALAEHLARHKKGNLQPDTIKLFKDRFLRVPIQIEMSDGEEGEPVAATE